MSLFTQRLLGVLAGGGVALPAVGSLIMDFDPASIAQADNSAVATWTDSVSGIVANQGTGANQPTLKLNSLGTNPAVVFGGTHWLPIATPGAMGTAFTAKNYTVLFVLDNVTANTNGAVFGGGAGGDSLHFSATGSTIGRYSGSHTVMEVPATGTAAPATFHTFGCTSVASGYPYGPNPARERLFVRGMPVHHKPSAPPAAAATFALGSLSSAGIASFNLKGRLYRMLMWNRELTIAEMLQAEIYLCTKYGQPLPWAAKSAFVVYDGDSISAAVGGTGPTNCWPYISAVSGNSLSYGQFMVTSVGGITKAGILSKQVELMGIPAQVGKRMVYAVFEYYNDRALTGAANYSLLQGLITGIKSGANAGYDIKTVIGDSTSSGADPDANRASLDSLLTTTPLGDQAVFMSVDATMGVSGAAATNFPTFFNSDGSTFVHPTDAGYALLAPYWTPKIAAAIAM